MATAGSAALGVSTKFWGPPVRVNAIVSPPQITRNADAPAVTGSVKLIPMALCNDTFDAPLTGLVVATAGGVSPATKVWSGLGIPKLLGADGAQVKCS